MKPIDRRSFIKNSSMGLVGLSLYSRILNCAEPSDGQVNFVVILVDDMGYGDMTCMGHPTIHTTNLDQMADEGVVMTQFYSASPVCSPSRAALLTGRYPVRTGIVRVLWPQEPVGLPKTEITLAESLKTNGYKTAAIGKWHLGYLSEYMPTQRGFDYYYGLPYSNDMRPLELYRNDGVIEDPVDQDTLTRRYTEEAVRFIEGVKDRPFFLYLAHNMPHVPLGVSEEFRGRSKAGLYGDVIEEIDWSVGRVMDALKRAGHDDNTLVLFTSDNGPWTLKKLEGGSAGLLRGGKSTTFEGGVREPFIARFPGRLPKGVVCTEVGTMMDIYPTCLNLAGITPPRDRLIDGKDIFPVLRGTERSPHEVFCYFWMGKLTAIRMGRYKLHFKMSHNSLTWQVCEPPQLYDLEEDPSERYDLAGKMPDEVANLTAEAERVTTEIAERRENWDLIEQLGIDPVRIPHRSLHATVKSK